MFIHTARYLFVSLLLVTALPGCSGGGGTTDSETSGTDTSSDTNADAVWEETVRLDVDGGALLAAWGFDTGVTYAVGGNPDKGVILRYSGDTWIEELVGQPVPLLNWVDGNSGDVWIVGNEGVALRQIESGWAPVPTPTSEPLWGVWGASPSDVWAVGGDPVSEDPAVMVHFDGVEWQEVELPPIDRPLRALFKVWGTSADHVFAVGESGVILRYDGASWTQEASGSTKDLISLWGNAPDNILAVGGRSIATLVRYDGETWSEALVEVEPGLNGVWMDAAGYAYVCGQRGHVGVVAPGAMTYTSERITDLVLHGSFGLEDGPLFAVGGSLDRNAPWQGVALVGAR